MQPIKLRHKNVEFEYHGWPFVCKPGRFLPLKLSYNGSAGWWISRKVFLSMWQLKAYVKLQQRCKDT